MATRKLEVVITGDARGLERAFGKGRKDSSAFGRTLSNVATVAGGIWTAQIGGKLVDAARAGFQELADGQRVSAQTAAVLKSTGAVAGVTAGQVEGLAGSLSRMSGVDDEAIQAGENMLLTFKNIRNEAGKGNDIFDQSTKTLVDFAVAMGKEPKDAAIQLGKALNDPVKGVTALGRAGVQFTDAQKDSIKAMVESGDTMGAQKLVLKELETQFGGSAKAAGDTFPGQLNKLRNSFDDLMARGIERLLPALIAATDWMTNTGIPALSRFFGGAQRLAQEHWPRVQQIVGQVVDWFKVNVVPTARAIADGIEKAWARIEPIARANFQGALKVIEPTMKTIKAVIETVLALIRGDWSEVWAGLKAIVSNALRAAVAVVRAQISVMRATAKALGAAIWDGIKAGLGGLAGLGKDLSGRVLRGVASVAEAAYSIATSIGKAIVNGVIDGLGGLATRVKEAVGGLLKRALPNIDVPGFSPPESAAAKAIGRPIAEGVARGILERGVQIKTALTSAVVDAIREAKGNASSLAGGLASSIGAGIEARAASRIAGVDDSDEAKRLRAIEATQRDRAELAAAARLAAAIDSAEDDEAKRQAKQDLDDWLLDQEAETLRASLDQQRTAIQDQEDDRKSALERGLADLTDTFNRGGIKAKEFNQQLQEMLKSAGVDYTSLGESLGSAFANAFRDQLQALQQQIREVATGPQAGRVTGAEPDVVSPFATQFAEWDERRRQLVKNLAEARKRSTAAAGAGGKDITAAERKRITAAEGALKDQLAARPTRDGITVVQNITVPGGPDANALMAAASWQLRTAVA